MKPEFSKYADGLVPTIVQDAATNKILMLGFMNEEAFNKTNVEQKVSFYSRSKKRVWTKGETSGNFLTVKKILTDCDNDTLLIKAIPSGPVCHTGADTCFNETNSSFCLEQLEEIIRKRKEEPLSRSYTASLFEKGKNKIAQKVGEEAVEYIIEMTGNDDEKLLNEGADLLFHFLVSLSAKGFALEDIVTILSRRHRSAGNKST